MPRVSARWWRVKIADDELAHIATGRGEELLLPFRPCSKARAIWADKTSHGLPSWPIDLKLLSKHAGFAPSDPLIACIRGNSRGSNDNCTG